MRLFHRLAAFALVTLWVPALLHCRLEAAGLLFTGECCDTAAPHADPAPDRCLDDACDTAEGEFLKPATSALSAPLPQWVACVFTAPLPELPDGLVAKAEAEPAGDGTAPPEYQRTWCFVQRAARPARAPSIAA